MNTRTLTGPFKSRWIDGQTYFSATLSRAKLFVLANEFKLDVLDRGSCEALKAGIHATTLGLAVVMGLYNAAAWVRRREQHLAVKTVLYAALTEWEREQVAHHLAQRRQPRGQFHEQSDAPTRDPCQSRTVAE